MKKILTVLLILAVAAGGLFAQEEASIGFSGWGRGVFVPFQVVNPDDAASYGTAGHGVNWGGNASIGMTIEGHGNEKVGFKIDFNGNGGAAGIGDFAYLWVKPIEQIKLSLGRFNEDTVRGKLGGSDFAEFTVAMKGEDNIFNRFQTPAIGGFHLGITPIEGLFIGAGVRDLGLDAEWTGLNGKTNYTNIDNGLVFNRAQDYYKNIQVTAGYTIPGIGLVRAQYWGDAKNGIALYTPPTVQPLDAIGAASFSSAVTDLYSTLTKATFETTNSLTGLSDSYSTKYRTIDNNQRIELAFAFTGVEGLTVDVGGKYYLPVKAEDEAFDIPAASNPDPNTGNIATTALLASSGNQALGDVSFQKPIVVALAAKYELGDLSVYGRFDTEFAGKFTIDGNDFEMTSGFGLNAHLIPEYKLGDALTVGAELGIAVTPEIKASVNGTSVSQYEKSSEVIFGAGAYAKQSLGNGSLKGGLAFQVPTDGNGKTFVFSIPVILEYSF